MQPALHVLLDLVASPLLAIMLHGIVRAHRPPDECSECCLLRTAPSVCIYLWDSMLFLAAVARSRFGRNGAGAWGGAEQCNEGTKVQLRSVVATRPGWGGARPIRSDDTEDCATATCQ